MLFNDIQMDTYCENSQEMKQDIEADNKQLKNYDKHQFIYWISISYLL